MDTIEIKIREAIQIIEQTTGFFYEQKTEKGYQILEKTLTILSQTVILILDHNSKEQGLNFDENKFNRVLTEAFRALEQKDAILLSDILKYDIEGILEGCLKDLYYY